MGNSVFKEDESWSRWEQMRGDNENAREVTEKDRNLDR